MLIQQFFAFFSDWLTLFFVFMIALISVPVLIYSVGYMKEYQKQYSLKYFYALMLIFIGSMMGVVLARNSITFMTFWEFMSIASFFLVIYEHNNKESIHSGIMYFIMTHISGLLLLVMFSLFYKYTGSFDLSQIARLSVNFSNNQKWLIFIFALLGFGAKAGIIPLHAWLPKAHPAAPSNVSALMSGVMIKIALYGFIRVVFVMTNGLPKVFGVIVLIIGTLSAIYAIINALFQNDIKKLLAFSSAENIGMITATIGLAMILHSLGLSELSILALSAALFHIMNHAVFKSLLFTSAGSVLFATGSKNMNILGGLHKKMKFTAVCAFIGTASISAVPPLNGFASEMQIFRSFITAGSSLGSLFLIITIIGCGILLALTSGGAVYTAVKSFGMTYLGAPRSEKAEKVHEIPKSMNLGMGILSCFSILLGIGSPFVFRYVTQIAGSILSTNIKIYFDNTLPLDSMTWDILIISCIFFIVLGAILLLSKILSTSRVIETKETWGCGYNRAKSFMQYTGSGYTQPVSRVFGKLVGYKKALEINDTVLVGQKVYDIIEKYLYKPIVNFFYSISNQVAKLHHGAIQLYVLYIFIALLVTVILIGSLN